MLARRVCRIKKLQTFQKGTSSKRQEIQSQLDALMAEKEKQTVTSFPDLQNVQQTIEKSLDKMNEPNAPTRPETKTKGTLAASIRANLAKYPNTLLLTQVGSFYESYFAQAPIIADILRIRLTSKVFQNVRYPACGFPVSQAERHLGTLVRAGYRVVLVDEMDSEDIAGTSKLKTRKVTRIVTPGTGIDDSFVSVERSNYLLALGYSLKANPEKEMTICYRDISTGSAFAKVTSLDTLRDDLLFVSPVEVIVPSSFPASILNVISAESARQKFLFSSPLLDVEGPARPDASFVIRDYIQSTLMTSLPVETHNIDANSILKMDVGTLQSLEVIESLRGGKAGAMLGRIRKTSTPGGARLLELWLSTPLTRKEEIMARQTVVKIFHRHPSLRSYIQACMRPLTDNHRNLQKFAIKKGTPSLLLDLENTLRAVDEIKEVIKLHEPVCSREEVKALRMLVDRIQPHDELKVSIAKAIDRKEVEAWDRKKAKLEDYEAMDVEVEEQIWDSPDEWFINPRYNKHLSGLHNGLEQIRANISTLQSTFREDYQSPDLKFLVKKKEGPVVCVPIKGSQRHLLDDSKKLIKLSQTRKEIFYASSEWSELFTSYQTRMDKIGAYQRKVLKDLNDEVSSNFEGLIKTASALDEIDVLVGFAQLAQERRWVKPSISEKAELNIVGGRHPSVEPVLLSHGRLFQPNSVELSVPDKYIHVITGPNMAGKSTFLRQTALIVILAQCGSFVPAKKATIGIVDQLFSRVGARDELDRDRSTFRIEMDEAASIVKNATGRSLVLLDELGRGTSPIDGLSIAYGVLQHLAKTTRCRTLFATHYHRLGELFELDKNEHLSKKWRGIEFWCSDLVDTGKEVHYSHRIRKGLNADSAGLVIARTAGLPEDVLKAAHNVREMYSQ